MVVVAGDVARISALYVAHRVAEAIPDTFSSAVEVPSAFDLIGSGFGTPEKVFWKPDLFCAHALPCGWFERRIRHGAGKLRSAEAGAQVEA
jgi:hypothetical protein